MKHKYISTKSSELLSYFNEQGGYCFDYTLAYMVFPDANKSTVRELLSDIGNTTQKYPSAPFHIDPLKKVTSKSDNCGH